MLIDKDMHIKCDGIDFLVRGTAHGYGAILYAPVFTGLITISPCGEQVSVTDGDDELIGSVHVNQFANARELAQWACSIVV